MVKFTYYKFKEIRKVILRENDRDYISEIGENRVIISAPHGVTQRRLGRLKVAELGTIPVAKIVANETKSNLIVKTRNLNDDANFDYKSKYRQEIKRIIRIKKCRYLLDIHGMSKNREYDINLGIHLGQNIKVNEKLFDEVLKIFKKNNFTISIDQPFCAGYQTISGYFAKKYQIWTMQIEINCDITNNPINITKCNRLVNTLIEITNLLNSN